MRIHDKQTHKIARKAARKVKLYLQESAIRADRTESDKDATRSARKESARG